MERMEKMLLEMNHITKAFPGVLALSDVDFNLREGEIHALCGENGAGKSTLMKILAGNYLPTSGDIIVEGSKVVLNTPLEAEQCGIAIVYQELSLSGTVTVAENMFMGREPVNAIGMINYKKLNSDAKSFLNKIHCTVEPDVKTKQLTIAEMQMVQIAKALSCNAKILIMDEPCSSITETDSKRLFEILKDLKEQGVGIVYIDHRLENIFQIADRVTVFRDGKKIGTKNCQETNSEELVQMMVGREITSLYPKESVPQEKIRLKISNYSNKAIHDIAMEVRKGEVLGLGGLVGAGRSEIIRAIFGVDKVLPGHEMELDGEKITINGPDDAVKAGIGYVPEDRKLEGLCLRRDIIFNTVMVYLNYKTKGLIADDHNAKEKTEEQIKHLSTKVSSPYDKVEQLSGGNQQKVVIAKWLVMEGLKVLLLDEPTRGIDVGAKHEIYKVIDNLAAQGISVIVITSELPELLGICDRIMIVNRGRIKGVLERSEFSQEAVMRLSV